MTTPFTPVPSCEELLSGYIPYPAHRGALRDRRGNPVPGALAFVLLIALAVGLRLNLQPAVDADEHPTEVAAKADPDPWSGHTPRPPLFGE